MKISFLDAATGESLSRDMTADEIAEWEVSVPPHSHFLSRLRALTYRRALQTMRRIRCLLGISNLKADPSPPVKRLAERQAQQDVAVVYDGTQHMFVQLIAQKMLHIL